MITILIISKDLFKELQLKLTCFSQVLMENKDWFLPKTNHFSIKRADYFHPTSRFNFSIYTTKLYFDETAEMITFLDERDELISWGLIINLSGVAMYF